MVAFKYFVAAPEDLPAAFPGWRFPLAVPERRQLTNPFTREPIFNADGTPFMITSARPLGPWLERPRCPQLAAFSPIDIWPVSSLHVAALAEALGVSDSVPEDVLFAPESWLWSLTTVSLAAVRAIAQIDAPVEVIAAWHAILRARKGDWLEAVNEDVPDWQTVLEALIRLCRTATAAQRVHIYVGADPEDSFELPANWTIEHGTLE